MEFHVKMLCGAVEKHVATNTAKFRKAFIEISKKKKPGKYYENARAIKVNDNKNSEICCFDLNKLCRYVDRDR